MDGGGGIGHTALEATEYVTGKLSCFIQLCSLLLSGNIRESSHSIHLLDSDTYTMPRIAGPGSYPSLSSRDLCCEENHSNEAVDP